MRNNKSIKVYFKESKIVWKKFLFFVVCSTVIVAVGTVLIEVFWGSFIGTIIPSALVLSALISLLFGLFILPYYLFKENSDAFNYIFEIKDQYKNSNVRSSIKRYLQNRWDNLLVKFLEITEESNITDNQYTQFVMARTFSSMAKNYFWATSFDIPSEFPIKNRDYLLAMKENKSMNKMYRSTDIPCKARIFFITIGDFVKEVHQNAEYLIEVIEHHLFFDEKTNKLVNCLQFFFYDADKKEYNNHYSKCDRTSYQTIYDYMIMDDTIVYGRHQPNKITLKTDKVDLLLYTKENTKDDLELIQDYKDTYKELWNYSLDFKQIFKRFNNDSEFKRTLLEAIGHYCNEYYIDSSSGNIYSEIGTFLKDVQNLIDRKENQSEIDEYYKSHIGLDISGEAFFNKWVKLIEGSKETCAIAIDSSFRKTKDKFFNVWDANNKIKKYEEYTSFFIASERKTQDKMQRIFVIEGKFSKQDESKLQGFLVACVKSNIEVGIISTNDLGFNTNELKLYTDFIILNLTSSKNIINNKTVGFTLETEKLLKAEVNQYSNCILPSQFDTYIDHFKSIWHKCIVISNSREIEEQIPNLIE